MSSILKGIDVDESLADDFMAMAKAKGYNLKPRGSVEQQKAERDAMLAQRKKDAENRPAPPAPSAEEVASAKEKLAQLERVFDKNYQYSDDHSVWSKNHDIAQQISSLKKLIARGEQGVTESGYQSYQSLYAKLEKLKKQYDQALTNRNIKADRLRKIRDAIIKLEFDLRLQEGVAEGLNEFAMSGGDDDEDPFDNYPCYDCGSTIFLHHTELCELAEENAIRDLPAKPGSQHWTGQIPKGLHPIPGLQEGVAEGFPQPGESSGKAKQFNPNAKVQTKEMTLDQILATVKGIPYVNNVVDDWDAKDYSWGVTKKVIEYAQYLQKNPQSVANLPPLVVIDGQLNDGAHRLSAINLLQKRMDPKNPLWKQVKLKVNFGTSADVAPEQGVAEAGSPAQQAAIAINMKKRHQKPKNEAIGDVDLESAYRRALEITKQIKYDDTATQIIVEIQMLAEKTGIDMKQLNWAIDDVREAKNQLESAVYGLDEVFKEAMEQQQYRDEEGIDEDTAYGGGMGQGHTGQSYRKFTPKSAGTFNEMDSFDNGTHYTPKMAGTFKESKLKEEPDTSGPIGTQPGGWRTYRVKSAGTNMKRESSIMKGIKETNSTGTSVGSAGVGGGPMVGGPTTYEQEFDPFKRKGARRITAMTY